MVRFVHISDLHIGKRLKEVSLEKDQRHILEQIIDIALSEKADAMIIAGDVYDNGTAASNESVRMLDWFLTELSEKGIETYMISGNHDSAEKLGFGNRMLGKVGIHISGTFDGDMEQYSLPNGEWGSVDIYLLPFIKPIHVRRLYADEEVPTYGDAVRIAIENTEIIPGNRKRILVTHQFVTSGSESPERCDSENIYVGGTENVPASLFDGFDYVALGHIHTPQSIGRETICYCGSPLKYSVSECGRDKSVTIVDITDRVEIREVPLRPLRDLRVIKGPLDRLIEEGKKDPDREDFIHVRLTDEPMNALARIREVYPNTIGLETPEHGGELLDPEEILSEDRIDAREAFSEFFRGCTGKEMSERQKEMVDSLMDELEVVL